MLNDPRVAPPPAPSLADIHALLRAKAPSHVISEASVAYIRAKNEREKQHAQAQNEAALLAERFNKEFVIQRAAAGSAGFMPQSDWKNIQMPNFGNQPFVGFFHDVPENPSVLQERALKQMNPIARDKYESLFEMLHIQVRYSVSPHWNSGNMWELRRIEPGKAVVTMSWSAPDHDPGCGLATWDAMVSELLDEITRCANNQLPSATGPTITGQQICGSAGTP